MGCSFLIAAKWLMLARAGGDTEGCIYDPPALFNKRKKYEYRRLR